MFIKIECRDVSNSQNFAASQKIKVIPNVETYQLHHKK